MLRSVLFNKQISVIVSTPSGGRRGAADEWSPVSTDNIFSSDPLPYFENAEEFAFLVYEVDDFGLSCDSVVASSADCEVDPQAPP